LTDWLEIGLPNWFDGRLLEIDTAVADRWGRIQASAGRTLPAIDGLLAATAPRHGLTLVTRNTRDFEGIGLWLVNPWEPTRSQN
jgi:predicted nucleic acid-binding protein